MVTVEWCCRYAVPSSINVVLFLAVFICTALSDCLPILCVLHGFAWEEPEFSNNCRYTCSFVLGCVGSKVA